MCSYAGMLLALDRWPVATWFPGLRTFMISFLSGLPKVVYHWPGWATNFQNLTICLHTSEIKEGRKIIDFQIVMKGGLGFSFYLLKGYIVFCIIKGQLSSLFLSRCKRKTVRLEFILTYFIIYLI